MTTDLTPKQLEAFQVAIDKRLAFLDAIEVALMPFVMIDGRQPWNERYTTHDKWAFRLVDELVEDDATVMVVGGPHGTPWMCTVEVQSVEHSSVCGANPSRQVAICLAYLKARGVDVDKLLKDAT